MTNPIAKSHHDKGISLVHSGDMNGAISEFKQAILKDPNLGVAYHNIGFVLLKQNQNKRAVDYFRKCIECSPRFVNAYVNLGIALSHLKRWDKAETAYLEAISIDPTNFAALTNLGIVYKSIGEHKKAINYYKTAMLYNSKSPELYLNIGNAHNYLQEYELALEAYNQALELQPRWVIASYSVALTLAKLDRINEAIAQYRSTLELDINDYESLIGLTHCLYLQAVINRSKPYAIEAKNTLQRALFTRKFNLQNLFLWFEIHQFLWKHL